MPPLPASPLQTPPVPPCRLLHLPRMGFACLPGCQLPAIDCTRHAAAQPPFASHCHRCMLDSDAWPH
eukprot:2433630-Alexandrium_andersonii.AAC.1